MSSIHLRGESNKRGDKRMNYIKPQISNVLNASLTIQGEKGKITAPDGNPQELHVTVAAYQADE